MQVLLKTFFLFLIFRIIILCIIENIVLLHDFFYSLFLKFYSFILNYGCSHTSVGNQVKVCDICGDAGREDLLAICSRCTDGAEHT